MKRIILTACVAYLLGFGSFAVLGTNEQPIPRSATQPVQVDASEAIDEMPAMPAVRLTLAGVTSDRVPVPRIDEADLERAIAEANEVKAQYSALLAADDYPIMLQRMEQAEGKVNGLLAEIEHLRRELVHVQRDPATPFGHFALMPEAADLDASTLYQVQDWLEKFPVFLSPSEAEWLIARTIANDWNAWPGRGTQGTVIAFLGPARLKAELPPARVAELVERYADEPGVFPE